MVVFVRITPANPKSRVTSSSSSIAESLKSGANLIKVGIKKFPPNPFLIPLMREINASFSWKVLSPGVFGELILITP